jgi:acyl-homoserine lactone acylase PvdQ
VETGGETARGLHAIRVLDGRKDFTLESLMASAYDSYLTWFDKPLPALIGAWERLPVGNDLKARTAEQIGVLRAWDRRWSRDSIATTLAVFWGEEVRKRVKSDGLMAAAPPELLLESLAAVSGSWKTPWGEINRFQRLTGDMVQPFSEAAPSIPVGFTSAVWGSLASFGARPYAGTKKWYGTSGNSFVAVVEFGDRVSARAVTAGGESGNPASRHFNDEAARYAAGDLREVYFYREQLKGHTEREYRPGS